MGELLKLVHNVFLEYRGLVEESSNVINSFSSACLALPDNETIRRLKRVLDDHVSRFIESVTKLDSYYNEPGSDDIGVKKHIKRAIDAVHKDAVRELKAEVSTMFPIALFSERLEAFRKKFSDKPIIHDAEDQPDAFLQSQSANLEATIEQLKRETSDSMQNAAYYEQKLLALTGAEQCLKQFAQPTIDGKRMLDYLDGLITENRLDLASVNSLSEKKPENHKENGTQKFVRILKKHITQNKGWPAMPEGFFEQLNDIAFGSERILLTYVAICRACTETEGSEAAAFSQISRLTRFAGFLDAVRKLYDFIIENNQALREIEGGLIPLREMSALPTTFSAYTHSYIIVGNVLYYIDANNTLQIVDIDVDQFKRDFAQFYVNFPVIDRQTVLLQRKDVKRFFIDKGHTPVSPFEQTFRSDLLSAVVEANSDIREKCERTENTFIGSEVKFLHVSQEYSDLLQVTRAACVSRMQACYGLPEDASKGLMARIGEVREMLAKRWSVKLREENLQAKKAQLRLRAYQEVDGEYCKKILAKFLFSGQSKELFDRLRSHAQGHPLKETQITGFMAQFDPLFSRNTNLGEIFCLLEEAKENEDLVRNTGVSRGFGRASTTAKLVDELNAEFIKLVEVEKESQSIAKSIEVSIHHEQVALIDENKKPLKFLSILDRFEEQFAKEIKSHPVMAKLKMELYTIDFWPRSEESKVLRMKAAMLHAENVLSSEQSADGALLTVQLKEFAKENSPSDLSDKDFHFHWLINH